MNDYSRCIDQWNSIFSGESCVVSSTQKLGIPVLDEALDWLCDGTESVLDFGCGNGSLLFSCALRGMKRMIGIDLSRSGIQNALLRAEKMQAGLFLFLEGSLERLAELDSESIDGIILSNILDNLYPEDARALLAECFRILRCGGKTLIKLNPYLTQEQIEEWGIKTIAGNLLDDGILLWNNSTEEWRGILSSYFAIKRDAEVYYPEHDQTNRLFFAYK